MQRYTIFFIIVNALQVSGGFSAHHQELKNCTHSIRQGCLLLPLASSVVVKAMRYKSEGPGIDSRCRRVFFRGI
jgi:hypothetical protein